MKVPRKGVRSPPRFELSGSEPSDEPQSRSVNSPEKATPTPRATEWAAIRTAAKPRVVVEGMRKATSTDESDGALLRRGMPGGAEAVVKVITPSPERRRLLAARMRRHPLRYAANARSGRVAGLRPLPLWVPPVYLLHHRLVDVQGYVSIDNNRYSVPNDLIGRRVEVRQTKEHIETYRGPRLVAVHRRVLEPTGRKYRLPEHVYKRGQAPPRVDSAPLEKTLLERLPEIAEYLQALKKHYPGHYLTPRLRRLLEMLNDYPRPVLLEALETARHYGLFDLERVEKLILRKLAREHFQINPRGDDDE